MSPNVFCECLDMMLGAVMLGAESQTSNQP